MSGSNDFHASDAPDTSAGSPLPVLQPPQPGTLYVVATPIGHLGDLSPRAAHMLRECDAVACEDTRVTRTLLMRAGSSRPLISYHDHREEQQAERLLTMLREGRSIALVSDAGTPGVSDPGFRVVRACRRAGLPVIPVPGPSAAIAALCASGLPTNGFLFAGFLQPRESARRKFLEKHRAFEYTLILYESCHRAAALARDIVAVLGPKRYVCCAREVTKKFETIITGRAEGLAEKIEAAGARGEFTFIIAPEDYEL